MTPNELNEDMQSLPRLGPDSREEDEITVRDRVVEQLRGKGFPERADMVYLIRRTSKFGLADLPGGESASGRFDHSWAYSLPAWISAARRRLSSLGNTVDEELEQLDEMRELLQGSMERMGRDDVAAISN